MTFRPLNIAGFVVVVVVVVVLFFYDYFLIFLIFPHFPIRPICVLLLVSHWTHLNKLLFVLNFSAKYSL